jgi:CrcB protein
MTWALVALGAAVGAPARYLTDRLVQSRHDSVFPWGTLTVNVVGCLVLGALTGAADRISPGLAAALGTGFCGALTTYSTFSYETLRLVETRARLYALLNVVASLVGGLGAAALGWWIGAGWS